MSDSLESPNVSNQQGITGAEAASGAEAAEAAEAASGADEALATERRELKGEQKHRQGPCPIDESVCNNLSENSPGRISTIANSRCGLTQNIQ